MSNITRYEVWEEAVRDEPGGIVRMEPFSEPHPKGEWVKYDDHADKFERQNLAYEDLRREYDELCAKNDRLRADRRLALTKDDLIFAAEAIDFYEEHPDYRDIRDRFRAAVALEEE